jgi:hypothetical protein
VNQIAGRRVERKCLAQLLAHPGTRWMSRYIEMKNSPPLMSDDKEAIENAGNLGELGGTWGQTGRSLCFS